MKKYSPAVERNREAVAAVLSQHLPKTGKVLEIGSGTGEHALHFANQFGDLEWQPSDADIEALPSVNAWAKESCHGNISPAICVNTTELPWPVESVDVVFSANMIHISPWSSCEGLIQGSQQVLSENGLLFIYGPFFRVEHDPEPTNLAFDRSLRNRHPEWGIRHLERVQSEAEKNHFVLEVVVDMPANNLSVVFRKVAP